MIALAVLAVLTNTDDVRACLPLGDGAVLVGTSGGLVRGDRVLTASDGLPGTRIDAIVPDDGADAHRAWIATDAGVAEVDTTTLAVIRAQATRPVRDVVRLGRAVYLATWDGGVIELGPTDVGAPLPMRGGNAKARLRVSALAIADGTLYAGTAAGLYALRKGTLERIDGAPADIASLAADPVDGTLWMATPDGAWRRDRHGASVNVGGGDVRRIAVVDTQVVLAGDAGLSRVDRGRVVALEDAPKLGFAQAVASAHGATCAGGLDGLWHTRGSDGWLHVTPAGGLPSNDISALAADGDALWVGTFDQGLATHDAAGWHRVATPGLDARIDAIVVGPEAIWIGTAEGAVALDRKAHRVVARVGRRDGLPGRSVLALARLASGRVVAGSSSGAAFIDGDHVERVGPRGVGNVWAIAEASDGTLWLGATTGLYHGPASAWSTKDGGDEGTWQRFSVASGALHDDWVTALAVKGDAVWVGTYRGGVVRVDGDHATQLGDGWINPGGLAWDGERLLASTMDGLRAGDGQSATWAAMSGLPGRDTTATARTGRALWVATRRGLAAL